MLYKLIDYIIDNADYYICDVRGWDHKDHYLRFNNLKMSFRGGVRKIQRRKLIRLIKDKLRTDKYYINCMRAERSLYNAALARPVPTQFCHTFYHYEVGHMIDDYSPIKIAWPRLID